MRSLVRRLSVIAYDAGVSALSLWLAFWTRFNFDSIPNPLTTLVYCFAFGAGSIVVFIVFGVSKGHWRFASLHDLQRIVAASVVTVILFVLGCFLYNRLAELPRSVPVIAGVTNILLLAGSRAIFRSVKARRTRGIGPERKRLMIFGTTEDADSVIRRFGLEQSSDYQVLGIVGFSSRPVGLRIRGVEVVSEVSMLEATLVRRGLAPDVFLIATPRGHSDLLKSVFAVAATRRIPLVRVAQNADVLTGSELAVNLKPIDLEDLLGRPPVRLEVERIRSLIRGRTVLVTGAGGSIGSEITRQVASYGPAKLVILDHSEFALYGIDAELAASHAYVDRKSILASVNDRDAVFRIINSCAPDLIYHAAALKHVPVVESNICEGVRTNLIGTRNVADAAARFGVKALVMISTDKAVRPSSVMGASKRAAEVYCQALDMSGSQTRFTTVRFGNVLGSSGSVVPLFEKQIRGGGPVTVTHPEMTRFFMSVREATELVLQASMFSLAEPQRKGAILVLDMGDPIKITNLARAMIAMSGKQPDVDIAISFTGMRPGEKLFEELLDPDEPSEAATMDGLIIAMPRFVKMKTVMELVRRVEAAANAGDVEGTLAGLREIVPEYAPPKLDAGSDRRVTRAKFQPGPESRDGALAGTSNAIGDRA